MTSGTGDKLKGVGNDVKGRTKEAIGDLTDRNDVHAEGKRDRMKGHAQEATGKVKETLDKAGDKLREKS